MSRANHKEKPGKHKLSADIDDGNIRTDFIRSLRVTGEILESCILLDIPYHDIINRRKSNPEFKEMTDRALEQGRAALHVGVGQRLRQIAIDGEEDRDAIKAAETIYKRDQVGGFGKTLIEHSGAVSFQPGLLAIRKDAKE